MSQEPKQKLRALQFTVHENHLLNVLSALMITLDGQMSLTNYVFSAFSPFLPECGVEIIQHSVDLVKWFVAFHGFSLVMASGQVWADHPLPILDFLSNYLKIRCARGQSWWHFSNDIKMWITDFHCLPRSQTPKHFIVAFLNPLILCLSCWIETRTSSLAFHSNAISKF